MGRRRRRSPSTSTATGDLDVLVGGLGGDIVYFQNVGTPTAPAFAAPVVDPFGLQGVPASSAPIAVDLDGDGHLDLLVGDDNGDIWFFKNTGTATAPAFAAPVKNPFGLSGVGNAASPALVDIDGDGDFDAFIGNRNGDTKYFQNIGTKTAPNFAPGALNQFGLTVVSGDAAPRFADLDGDGDLDAWIGSNDGTIQYFANTGTPSAPAFAALVENPFGLQTASAGSVPAFGDLDGDGDLDLLVGLRSGNMFYFQNIGTPSSPTFDSSDLDPFGLQSVDRISRPVLVDLDGDGDLDVAIGTFSGDTVYFENIGTAGAPAYAAPVTNPFGLARVANVAAPAFANLDGDGDLDAWIGDGLGNVNFFLNVGTATAPSFAAPVQNPFGLTKVNNLAAPTFADIDGDGDLDAFIGTGTGNLRYFQNTGTATAPTFASGVNIPFGLANVQSAAAPQFLDVDLDGDLDALVGNRDGDILFFQNVGDASTPVFASPVTNPFGMQNVGGFAAPAFGDIDNDGSLDGLIGNDMGNAVFFRGSRLLTCDVGPRDFCSRFAGGSFLVNETKPGKEQLSAQLKPGPALAQADFGDPAHSHDGYALCLYDDKEVLAGQLVVDRGAAMCGTHPCWKNVGGKGYAYKDSQASADGVTQVALHAGAAGKSSVMLKAKNNAAKGQTALPTGIAGALFSSGTVTMQIQKAQGYSCYSATLSDSARYPGYMKAK